MSINLNDEERLAALRLIRSVHVGTNTFWTLLRLYGTAQNALKALPGMARRGGALKYEVCPKGVAEAEWENTQQLGGRFLFWRETDFPLLLKATPDYPPILTILGNASVLKSFSTKSVLAIVGARNASLNGQKFSASIAEELGQRNFIIVSGLARGIDTHAHKGSLKTGTGAIMAGGVDVVYPPENIALYEQVKSEGVLFSEMPLGMSPQASLFPKRNRIIAGISFGVVVIEAALRSGSLITANFALEYGREVFAVPGSPFDPRCRGTNALLKKGAILVEGVEDIMQTFDLFSSSIAQTTVPPENAPLDPISEDIVDKARTQILYLLSTAPTKVDELLEAMPHPLSAVLTALVELEVAGQISYTPGQCVCLNAQAFSDER
ncbi:MAG: DNA-processing protein DprA [Holosporales bacterium]|jgi:DNA processing protein|nr:DNA-processing protein DprA [Holosporales bacterium]